MRVIDLAEILRGKCTYPTWSSGQTYPLEIVHDDQTLKLTYRAKGGRKPTAEYPRFVELSPNLLWVLGFLRGEGSQSKGKSAYRRFTVTNNDFKVLRFVLRTLKRGGFLNELPDGCLKIGRNNLQRDQRLLKHWSKGLGIPYCKFYFPPRPDRIKRAEFGTCHVYISNVLLRLTIDAIAEHVFGLMQNPK